MPRWLDDLVGYNQILADDGTPARRRHILKFVGATVVDDGEATVVTTSGATTQAEYFLGAPEPSLPNHRLPVESSTIGWNLATPNTFIAYVKPGSVLGALGFRENDVDVAQRDKLNAINTASISLDFTDDGTAEEVELRATRAALTGAITAAAGSNATAFGAAAALSVLANATNASGSPDYLDAAAPLEHLRVNAAGNALEWSTLQLVEFPSIASDTFLGNTGISSAPPSAITFTSVAGNGLVWDGTNNRFDVGAGTGITVNANDVQIAAIAAESFFGNFTAGSAVPTARPGSSVAGNGLTYTAGGTLAVGSSTSIAVNANDVQRAALTGAVSAAVNDNTTRFAGIRTNGVLQTARQFFNLLDTASIAWTPTDDAGNDEWEMRANWTGLTVRSASSGNVQRRALRLIENAVYTWSLVDDPANDEVEATLNLNAIPFSSITTLAGISVLGRSVNSIGTMAAITATGARQGLMSDSAGTVIGWRPIRYPDVIEVVQTFTTSGTTNNLALDADSTILRIDTGNSDWAISGFARTGGNFHGDRITVMNASNTASEGEFQSQTGSLAGNQLILPGNVNRRGPRLSGTFEYDETDTVWRLVQDTGFSVVANNTFLGNNTGVSDYPRPITVNPSTLVGNITDGQSALGLGAHDLDEILRALLSHPNVRIFDEDFQGNIAGIIGSNARWSVVSGFAGIGLSGTNTSSFIGAINLDNTTGNTRGVFALGANENAFNFNFASWRYMCCRFRVGSTGTTAATGVQIGLVADHTIYQGGTAGVGGATVNCLFWQYRTDQSAGAWVGGITTSGSTSTTASALTATLNTAYNLEMFRLANGTVLYLINGTVFRTDSTAAIQALTGPCNFFINMIGTTAAARNCQIDHVRIISMY
jgi:hypothetical protein